MQIIAHYQATKKKTHTPENSYGLLINFKTVTIQ